MSEEDQLNIELRKEVLRRVLVIEEGVRMLLLFFLNTRKENRKAISKKSSVLSFNDKVNILYDLDVITGQEYQKLLLLAQFRNKFLHDIDCKSFSETIYMFKEFNNQGAMGKKLLSFHSDKNKRRKEGTENDYKEAYFCLAENLYDMITEKMDNYIDEKKEDYIFVKSLFAFYKKTMGMIANVLDITVDNKSIPFEIQEKMFKKIIEVMRDESAEEIKKIVGSNENILERFVFKVPSDITYSRNNSQNQ